MSLEASFGVPLIYTEKSVVKKIMQLKIECPDARKGMPLLIRTARKVTDKASADSYLQAWRDNSRTIKQMTVIRFHELARNHAEFAMQWGDLFNELKRIVRLSEGFWEEWVSKEIPYIHERTRQDYMRLAKNPDIKAFSYFGIYGMIEIINNAEKSGLRVAHFIGKVIPSGNDKIAYTAKERRKILDAVSFYANCQREGVSTVTYKESLCLCDGKVQPDKGLIKILKDMQATGQDLKAYLADLHMSGGSESSDDVRETQIEGFDSVAIKMIQTISSTMMDSVALGKVEKSLYNELKDKILEMEAVLETVQEEQDETLSCSNGLERVVEVS